MTEGRVINPKTGEEIFCHPETGERLETAEDFAAALTWIEEQMIPYYRVRRNMQDAFARIHPPAELPAPRYRTDKQNAVARCPRCGGKLDEGV